MLEYLRNAAEKPVAKILIGILAFSFVGWGVAEWIFGATSGNNTLVTVGGAEISAQQFDAARSRELAAMSRDQVRAAYADPASMNELSTRILTTLATQQMAYNRADDLGYVVSDKRIAHEISEFPEFQNDGKFSTAQFDFVLANSGLTEESFADMLRGDALRAMILGPISIPMSVPAFAATASYNARNATRDIEYAAVKFSDFNVGTPTDDQLREYYASNPHIIPEYRTASYVLIPADLAKPDAYDAAYKRATALEDDIIAGTSMSAAAKKHGAKYVALKPFAADARPVDAVLGDAMVKRIFDMDAGVESELIETKSGFVIMRVERIAPSHAAEFDDVKKDLVAAWRTAQAKKQAYVRANEILTDARRDGKIAKSKSASVSRTSGAPIDVLNAAFGADVDTMSIVPAADAFYVVNVRAEKMPAADDKKMTATRNELQNMMTRMLMDDYNSFLKRQYPIKVNEKVYRRIFGK